MIFEVRKGRECSETLTASLQAISALQILTQSQAGLIELKGKEVASLKELDTNWSLRLDNQGDLFQIEKSTLRQKVKKRNRVIIGMAGTIAVLVAVILGG